MANEKFPPYIGVKWDAENFNCWHLVQRWYKHHKGIDLPSFAVSPEDVLTVVKTMKGEQGRSTVWQELLTPAPGCVVAMGKNKHITHAGVWLEDNMVLHCSRDSGMVVSQNLNTLLRQWSTVKFYEFMQ